MEKNWKAPAIPVLVIGVIWLGSVIVGDRGPLRDLVLGGDVRAIAVLGGLMLGAVVWAVWLVLSRRRGSSK